eukprot:5868869-Amphidinium_carterae.4
MHCPQSCSHQQLMHEWPLPYACHVVVCLWSVAKATQGRETLSRRLSEDCSGKAEEWDALPPAAQSQGCRYYLTQEVFSWLKEPAKPDSRKSAQPCGVIHYPPGPPGGPGHDGQGDDWHRERDRYRIYRVWDDARPSYSSQQKPQTIDKHRRAIPKLEIGREWEDLPPATVHQILEFWVTQVQYSVDTWCRQVYTMFVTSIDNARIEHERWLDMSHEEQAAMERTFILGTVTHVPHAPDTITA